MRQSIAEQECATRGPPSIAAPDPLPAGSMQADALLRGLAGDRMSYRSFLGQSLVWLRGFFYWSADDEIEREALVIDCLHAIHAKRSTFGPDIPVEHWVEAIARYRLDCHHRGRVSALSH